MSAIQPTADAMRTLSASAGKDVIRRSRALARQADAALCMAYPGMDISMTWMEREPVTRPNGTYLPDHLEDPLPVNVPSRLSRRRLLQRGAALGISLPAIGWLLAACGGDDSDDDDGGNESAASPTAASSESTSASTSESGGGTAQNGGRLTVIQTGSIPDLDPQSAYDSDASAIFFGTYEMLVRLKGSDTFEYEPMLAESWEGNDDNSEWRFKIPAGVKFHDGTDCDAEAVAASFKRFHNMGLGPVNVITRFVASPDDISAEDATTVLFKLSFGTEIFVAALASQYGPLVVSPAAVEANKTADDEFAHEWFRSNVVGTGPYTISENVLGDHITMVRFEDYHGGWDGNHFDEIVFRNVEESSTRRQLMERGEADCLTQSLTPKDIASLQEAGVLNVMVYDSTNADWALMNHVKLADVKLRQGLCWAFPYDDVRKGVYEDLIEASSGACTTTTRGYPEDGFIYTTDLDKAKQLIDESGFDVSQPLEFWITSGDQAEQAIGQLFQANLQTLGITLDLVEKEEGALTDFLYGSAPAEERPDFTYWGWWPDYNDAWNEIYPNFHTDAITPNGSNAMYYSNKDVDALLDKTSGSIGEADYNDAIAEMNKIMVEDDPAAIFVGSVKWYSVLQQNIKGFEPNPIYINTYNVYDMYREE